MPCRSSYRSISSHDSVRGAPPVLLATEEHNPTVYRAARNIDRTTVSTVAQLNAWDILRNRALVITKDGLNKLIG